MPQLASVSNNGLRGWLPSLPTPKTKACPSLYQAYCRPSSDTKKRRPGLAQLLEEFRLDDGRTYAKSCPDPVEGIMEQNGSLPSSIYDR